MGSKTIPPSIAPTVTESLPSDEPLMATPVATIRSGRVLLRVAWYQSRERGHRCPPDPDDWCHSFPLHHEWRTDSVHDQLGPHLSCFCLTPVIDVRPRRPQR